MSSSEVKVGGSTWLDVIEINDDLNDESECGLENKYNFFLK